MIFKKGSGYKNLHPALPLEGGVPHIYSNFYILPKQIKIDTWPIKFVLYQIRNFLQSLGKSPMFLKDFSMPAIFRLKATEFYVSSALENTLNMAKRR